MFLKILYLLWWWLWYRRLGRNVIDMSQGQEMNVSHCMKIWNLNRWRRLKMLLLNCWLLVIIVCFSHQQFNLLEITMNLLQRLGYCIFIHCAKFWFSCFSDSTSHVLISYPSDWCISELNISPVSLLILRSCSRLRLQSKRLNHLHLQ